MSVLIDLTHSPVARSVVDGATLSLTASGVGDCVFVQTYRDFFVASLRASPPALASDTVLAHASGGNWRWERAQIAHASWAQQAAIYLDAAVGNDENDASQATNGGGKVGPIKTHAELVRRLGRIYSPQIVQTLFATGDCGPLIWTITAPPTGSSAYVHYRGALVAQTTTAISSVVSFNRATNTDASFHGDAGWTTSAEIDRLVIDATGRSTWVIEQGGGASGGSADAVVAPWCSIDLIAMSGSTSPTSGNTNNGTTITSYTQACTWSAATIVVSGNYFAVSDVIFGSFVRLFSQGANVFLNRCVVTGTLRCSGGNIYRNWCRYGVGMAQSPDGNDNYTRAFCNGGLSRVAWSNGATTPSGVTLRNDLVFTGIGYGTLAQEGRLFLDGCCFRNVTAGALITFSGLGTARINGALWGAGNTVPIAALDRGSRITTNQAAAAITVARSATSDFTFAGNTTARALDTVTGLKTLARTLNWANLEASVATTGFGQTMGDESTDCFVLKT